MMSATSLDVSRRILGPAAAAERGHDPLPTLWNWIQRHRQRRSLLRLDDRLLEDIGVSRADAEAEAAKPFWRA